MVNGRVTLGNPDAPAYMPGSLGVRANKTLTVTGSLAVQGGLTLGAEAKAFAGGGKGTLLLNGDSKDSARLDIAGDTVIGTDGGPAYATDNGQNGELALTTGIATLGGTLTVGGSSGNMDILGTPYGVGGHGKITVGKNAELHMRAHVATKLGGDGSDGWNDPVAGIPIPGLPGGKATVVSDGVMHLGNVNMGGDAGSGTDAILVVPGLTGGFGGNASMTLNQGSVTTMGSLKAGGNGGDGGNGSDGSNPAGVLLVGQGGLGGFGGKGELHVKGSLTITGETIMGGSHGAWGSDGLAVGVTPSVVPGGWGGFGGLAGSGAMTVSDGGMLTLGSKVTIAPLIEMPDISTILDPKELAKWAAYQAAGALGAHSYIEIGAGGTLKLTDEQGRDLKQGQYLHLTGMKTGLSADALISGDSSGTILFAGGTVEGKDLSASEGLTLGTGNGEVNAHIVTDRFTIGKHDDPQSATLKNGLSLTITGTSGYLLSAAAEAVTLDGGTLDVGGNIALMPGNTVTLLNAGYGNTHQTVGMTASSDSHMVTQGTAFAGDAPVDLNNNSLTAKVLNTTTKADGSVVASGQDVTVSNGGALHLTQDVSQGAVVTLGTTGTLFIDGGTLKLTGDVRLGQVGVDAGGNNTVASLSGVQRNAANTITFHGGTLQSTGILSYGGALTVGGTAASNVFGGSIVAGGISASSLHVQAANAVQLTGFANTARNFLDVSTLVDGGGSMTIGGVEGQGGVSSAAIAVGSTTGGDGSLTLKQGNFSTGTISLNTAHATINIGNGTDIGKAGSLQATVDVQQGALVVNNTATGGLYSLKGTVNVGTNGALTLTAGDLAVGTLNYNSSNALAMGGKSLSVGALNLGAQTITTGNGGTLAVNTLRSGESTARIDAAGGTLDLGAQHIKNLSIMAAGTAGALDGYAGSFAISDSTVKTTGTASYVNDTALTLHKQSAASTDTAFNGALEAGLLEAKTTSGALQDVSVNSNSLTLYGNNSAFLNVKTLVVNPGGSVQLGSKDYAPGGASAAHVRLAGGDLNVKGGMYTFTADKALSTSAASNVKVDDSGVLAFTTQPVDTLTAGQGLTFHVGSGLQTEASAGTLLFATTAGLANNQVSVNLQKGAVVMGGTGTLADLEWVSGTLKKWNVSAPAILAISGSNTIDMRGSTLKVGGDGQNHFGDNTLTMVDVTNFSLTKPALMVDGAAATFGKDARLLITGKLVDGNTHTILNSVAGYAVTDINKTWSVVNNPNRLVKVTTAFDTGNLNIIANVAVTSPQETMPGLSGSLGGLMQDMARDPNFGMDVHSGNAGVRFLSRVAHADYMAEGAQGAVTAEGAAQIGAVGNVSGSTFGAASGGATNAGTRMSFTTGSVDASKATALHMGEDGSVSVDSGLSAGSGMKNGLGLWLMPMYQHNSTWGMKAGEFKTGYNSDMFGVSVGADYTILDAFRFGLALNLGTGNSQSTGDFNPTDSRFNFWGLSLYGGWVMDNFGLSADVGYTSNFSAITQDMPVSMGMPNLKADVNSRAWTAGLRAEYKFATSVMDIIPHVGARYTGLTADGYDIKSGGQTVFDVEESFQSLWTFPVGVTLSRQFDTASGWSVTPKMDLGIVAATGDVKAKSRTRIPGLSTTAEMETQVVDYVSFDGGLGLEMKNDTLSFGVNYNIQASEHHTGHGLFGTFRVEF